MAKVAEGIARVAGGIATGRRRRSELASEIKALTRNCRGEVRSLLTSFKASRGQASRAQAAEIKKVTRTRHGEVISLLTSLNASRRKASLEQSAEAKKLVNKRHDEVSSLLDGLNVSRVRAIREYRKKAAAFMRDLTNGVTLFLNEFAKNDRDRAVIVHERLAAYALDRSDAVAIWRGRPRQGEHDAKSRHQPAAESSSAAHPKSSASESAVAKPDVKTASAAHSPEAATRSTDTQWPKSPIGRHGGGSK